VRRIVKALISSHLKPAFCAPYPLPQHWHQLAVQGYQKFRANFEGLLLNEARPNSEAPPK